MLTVNGDRSGDVVVNGDRTPPYHQGIRAVANAAGVATGTAAQVAAAIEDAVGLTASGAVERHHHWLIYYKRTLLLTLWDEVTLTIGSGDVTFRVRRSEDDASEVPGVVDVVYVYDTESVAASAANACLALYNAIVARVATDGALMGAADECEIRYLGEMGLLITRKASGTKSGTPTCSSLSQRVLPIEVAYAAALDPLAEYYRPPAVTEASDYYGIHLDVETMRDTLELPGGIRALSVTFWNSVAFSGSANAYLHCDDGSISVIDLVADVVTWDVGDGDVIGRILLLAPPEKDIVAASIWVNCCASGMEVRLLAAGF